MLSISLSNEIFDTLGVLLRDIWDLASEGRSLQFREVGVERRLASMIYIPHRMQL